MKRITIIAAALGALVFSSVALAGGNGTQVTQFKANYTDPVAGPVSCSGAHQVKKDHSIQESETCASTSGSPLTGYAPGQVFNFGGGYWLSDLDGQMSSGGTMTVSADGMSYNIIANY